MNQVQAGYGNYLHYTVNNTGGGLDKDNLKMCPDQFSQHAFTVIDTVKMTAQFGATDAKLDFSFTDSITGYVVKGALSLGNCGTRARNSRFPVIQS
jgi:hypothetical protein